MARKIMQVGSRHLSKTILFLFLCFISTISCTMNARAVTGKDEGKSQSYFASWLPRIFRGACFVGCTVINYNATEHSKQSVPFAQNYWAMSSVVPPLMTVASFFMRDTRNKLSVADKVVSRQVGSLWENIYDARKFTAAGTVFGRLGGGLDTRMNGTPISYGEERTLRELNRRPR